MRFWKSKKQLPPPPVHMNDPEDHLRQIDDLNNLLSSSGEKSFDWNHYQAMTGGHNSEMFRGEFQLVPTMRVMKSMLIQEPWINACITAIAKPFEGPRLFIRRKINDKQYKDIYSHPFLDYYYKAGSYVEGRTAFTANGIYDLALCGNAYWWTSPDKKEKRRLPAESVEPVVKDNRVIEYRVVNHTEFSVPSKSDVKLTLPANEVTHIARPNPFSSHVGLSLIVATVLPVLIDKYGREYIVGFFVRGGNTTGIIQTKTKDMNQLIRLMKTLMQAFGGRRNMHADKILPDGTEWKASSNSFRDINLADMLKQNVAHFRAATGCTNTVLSQFENINRATALAEMEFFWRQTILPMQRLWCAGIMRSPLWAQFGLDEDQYELCFDNSEIIYLDDFDRRLEQDAKLAATWTINERRERLGAARLDEGYDRLQAEITQATVNPFLGLSMPGIEEPKQLPAVDAEVVSSNDPLGEFKAQEAKIQEPTGKAKKRFQDEFDDWLKIILDNLEDQKAAERAIEKRADSFAEDLALAVMPSAMQAYDHQMSGAKESGKSFRQKENKEDRLARLEALRQRAEDVIKGRVFDNGKKNFLGYSKTATERLYGFIAERLEAGDSLTDIAAKVRMEFNASYNISESYSGQAETIVRTEFGSAISLAQETFGRDLASVSKTMTKDWVSMGDEDVRESHIEASQNPITAPSSDIVDAVWDNGLRYPRDAQGEAAEIINCRCVVRYTVKEWGD